MLPLTILNVFSNARPSVVSEKGSQMANVKKSNSAETTKAPVPEAVCSFKFTSKPVIKFVEDRRLVLFS